MFCIVYIPHILTQLPSIYCAMYKTVQALYHTSFFFFFTFLVIFWQIKIPLKVLHLICSVLVSLSLMVHRVEILDQLVQEPFCMRKMEDRYQIYATIQLVLILYCWFIKYCSWVLCLFSSQLYRFREGLGYQTSNAAEYRALILGLKQAINKGFRNISVQGDSNLVINQVCVLL